MRSTTPPTSRRMACATTRATWRWCARATAEIPIVLASATPSVETVVNARRGRYARLHLPERFGGQHLPRIEAIDLRARRSAARALHRAAAGRSREDRARARRAGAAVSQPPRLCAADAVPHCGHRLACPNCDAWLVDHRFKRRLVCHHCGYSMPPPRAMPEMRGDRELRRGRSRRRAAGAGGGRAVSRRPHPGAVQRPGRIGRAPARGTRRRRRRAGSTSSSAPSWSPRAIISPSSIWSASSTPISAWPTAIRAPPSAPSSCCTRWSAAPAARGRGIGYLQTHQPEHPVMRALIAAGPRGVLHQRDRSAREDRLSAVRPAGEPR